MEALQEVGIYSVVVNAIEVDVGLKPERVRMVQCVV